MKRRIAPGFCRRGVMLSTVSPNSALREQSARHGTANLQFEVSARFHGNVCAIDLQAHSCRAAVLVTRRTSQGLSNNIKIATATVNSTVVRLVPLIDERVIASGRRNSQCGTFPPVSERRTAARSFSE